MGYSKNHALTTCGRHKTPPRIAILNTCCAAIPQSVYGKRDLCMSNSYAVSYFRRPSNVSSLEQNRLVLRSDKARQILLEDMKGKSLFEYFIVSQGQKTVLVLNSLPNKF